MDGVAEGELACACREGRVLDCAADGARRSVAAAVIRRCLQARADIDPRGLRLRNAVIAGSLDLAGLDLPFPLRFEGCEFDSAPIVTGASLAELALTGCPRLPGLLGNGLRVRGDLDLSRSRVTGGHRTTASTSKRAAIWLCESYIGGRLLCVSTSIDADGERALQADRMHVGGTVRLLHGFTARGEVRLVGARVDGSLDLTGAQIESAGGLALDLGDATIEGSVYLISQGTGRRPVLQGRIDLGSARISGQFLIRDAVLNGHRSVPARSAYAQARAGGTAVSAARLAVGGGVTLEGSCEVSGGIDLSMSDMSSLSIGGACSLRGVGHPALDLTNAELRASLTIHPGAAVEGTLSLRGTRIRGDLSLRQVTLSVPESTWLIAGQGMTVDGDVLLQDMNADGGPLEFRGATLGSVVDASRARLSNPSGYTLSLHHAIVRGSVHLIDIESAGLVVLNRAAIGGRLQCTGGSFSCPGPSEFGEHGHAIDATSATIRGGMELGWASVSPSVDFTNTSTTYLADDPGNWPAHFVISGFTYDRFEQLPGPASARPWDHAARCAWLGRQAAYDAGSYEQAARVFRVHGYTSGAEEILIAQRRRAGQVAPGGRGAVPRRVLDAVYDTTVRYGYRPGRVLGLLLVLLVLVVASLEIPAGQATLRASDAAGDVYSAAGLLRNAGPDAPGRGTRRGGLADSCGDGQVRCFSPVLYAIDTVVPLVSLEQRSTWYPDSARAGRDVHAVVAERRHLARLAALVDLRPVPGPDHPHHLARPRPARLAVAAGQESGDSLVLLAGNERPGHRHQDLVGVGHAGPCRVPAGVGELHVRPLPARSSVQVAGLAAGRRAAAGPDRGRRLRQQREPGRGPGTGGRLGGGPGRLPEQHGVAVGVGYLHLAAERVRRVAHMINVEAGRAERGHDGIEILEEEVEQQRQPRDVERRPGRRQQDMVAALMQGRPRRGFRSSG